MLILTIVCNTFFIFNGSDKFFYLFAIKPITYLICLI